MCVYALIKGVEEVVEVGDERECGEHACVVAECWGRMFSRTPGKTELRGRVESPLASVLSRSLLSACFPCSLLRVSQACVTRMVDGEVFLSKCIGKYCAPEVGSYQVCACMLVSGRSLETVEGWGKGRWVVGVGCSLGMK